LSRELDNVGVTNPGPNALSMLDLRRPDLQWTALANGMGVEASQARTAEALGDQLADAIGRRGPRLIEAVFGA
ncbi:hypothetical protein, partial [Stenotrophomonas maltophilia]